MSEIPGGLRDALARGDVVPFVGAGVSMAVRKRSGEQLFPSWLRLIEAAEQELERKSRENPYLYNLKGARSVGDLLQAGNFAMHGLGEHWTSFLHDQIDPDLSDDQIEPASLDLARAVWGFGSLLVTTNYDRLLEYTCPTPCPARWVITSPGGMAAMHSDRLHRRTVWHLHGHLDDPTRLVLGTESYDRLYKGTEAYWKTALDAFRQLLSRRTLLFVGFSLDDPGVTEVMRAVAQLYEGAGRTAYCLCHEDQVANLRRRAREWNMQVEPVPFRSFGPQLVARVQEMSRLFGQPVTSYESGHGTPCNDDPNVITLPATSVSWNELVGQSPLWDGVSEVERWRALALRVVARCKTEWDDARAVIGDGNDPWRDDGFPHRVLSHLGTMLSRTSRSGPEVAVLVAAPFVHEAIWARAVAWLTTEARPDDFSPTDSAVPPRLDLEHIHRAHPAVLRRAERLSGELRRVVAFWLLHRAVPRMPDLWRADAWGPTESLLRDVATHGPLGDAILALARCIGAGPERLRGEGGMSRQPDLMVERAPLRMLQLGTLVAMASAMALELRQMSEVVVDHLGQQDDLSPDLLRQGVAGAAWSLSGGEWRLNWAARHPVEEHCLLELAQRARAIADALRAGASDRDELLRALPLAVSTSGLVPAVEQGRPCYRRPLIHFRLDHHRVRELLMGEQLYGDPTLAIRELYQNALDACRYRQARDRWLHFQEPAWGLRPPYEGRIIFRQGVENGRPYIECEDNGVGMDTLTLERVFAVAGQRFHDTPSYLEEHARWRAKPQAGVELWPNSQHGIGVLSYFMLADDLEVWTRPFGTNGALGPGLRVRICSASGLFRIEDEQRLDESGTRVRLYLAQGVCSDSEHVLSVTKTLLSLLWVSEFPVEVWEHACVNEDGLIVPVPEMMAVRWPPCVPYPGSLRLSKMKLSDEMPRPDDSGPRLWWSTSDEAPVLVDGIVTDEKVPFVLIDLRGGRRPALSTNRTKILNWDPQWVREILPGLACSLAGWSGCPLEWVWDVLMEYPTAALPAVAAMFAARTEVRVADRLLPLVDIGWMPGDSTVLVMDNVRRRLVRNGRRFSRGAGRKSAIIRPLLRKLPLHAHAIHAWRTSVWENAFRISMDMVSPNPRLPIGPLISSDPALWELIRESSARLTSRRNEEILGQPTVLGAVDLMRVSLVLGMLATDVVKQARLWGARLGMIVNRGVLTFWDAVAMADQLDQPVWVVARRFSELAPALGIDLAFDPQAIPQMDMQSNDLHILARYVNENSLKDGERAPFWGVLGAVKTLGLSETGLAQRLARLAAALGFSLTFDPQVQIELSEVDLQLLSQDGDGHAPYIGFSVTSSHLLRASFRLVRPVADIARRFAELAPSLGLSLTFDLHAISGIALLADDLRLLSKDLEGSAPYIEGDVSVLHVYRAAHVLGVPVSKAAHRIVELAQALGLSYTFKAEALSMIKMSAEDWCLLSRDLDGQSPWIEERVSSLTLLRAVQSGRPIQDVARRFARMAPVLGLSLDPAWKDVISAFNAALAFLLPLATPLPWPSCKPAACLAGYALDVLDTSRELRGVLTLRTEITRAMGRRCLWWLTEDHLGSFEEAAEPLLNLVAHQA